MEEAWKPVFNSWDSTVAVQAVYRLLHNLSRGLFATDLALTTPPGLRLLLPAVLFIPKTFGKPVGRVTFLPYPVFESF